VQAAPYQQTINRSFTVGGLGLHTGEEGELLSTLVFNFAHRPVSACYSATQHYVALQIGTILSNSPCMSLQLCTCRDRASRHPPALRHFEAFSGEHSKQQGITNWQDDSLTLCGAVIVRVRPAFAGDGRYFVRVPEGARRDVPRGMFREVLATIHKLSAAIKQ
jgi:hypothetical protein